MYQNIAATTAWKEVAMLIKEAVHQCTESYLQTQRCARKIMLLKESVQAMKTPQKKFKIRGGGTS